MGQRLRSRGAQLALVVGGVGLYSLLVGGDAAVVRAALMGMLYALGRHFRRPAYALVSLFIASFVMTFLNPFVLWDVSFQLSFAATLGLMLLVPPVASWVGPHVAKFSIPGLGLDARALFSELILVTSASSLAILPILLYCFGRLSPIAPLANLLILGAQPAVMVLGGLATLGGTLFLPLGRALGWLAWVPLTYTVQTVEFLADVPLASLDLPRPAPLAVGLYYAALLLAGQLARGRPEPQEGTKSLSMPLDGRLRAMLGLLLALSLLIVALLGARPDRRLHVAFLDVGEGDAIFIKGPQGQKVLIDGGPDPDILSAHLGRVLPFWDRILDLVVLTHPDEDHLGGLVAALERYEVQAVLTPGLECDSLACRRWEELLMEEDLEPTVATRGIEV
jgi:competence protein ComEC